MSGTDKMKKILLPTVILSLLTGIAIAQNSAYWMNSTGEPVKNSDGQCVHAITGDMKQGCDGSRLKRRIPKPVGNAFTESKKTAITEKSPSNTK